MIGLDFFFCLDNLFIYVLFCIEVLNIKDFTNDSLWFACLEISFFVQIPSYTYRTENDIEVHTYLILVN
jgi:hypothetical protein